MKIKNKFLTTCMLSFMCTLSSCDLFSGSGCNNESECVDPMAKNASRFSSTFGYSKDNDLLKYTMIAPYTDEYSIKFSNDTVSSYTIKDTDGKVLYTSTQSFNVQLTKNQVVSVEIQSKGKDIDVFTYVKALNHISVMPYDTEFDFDASTADVIGDNSKSPLKAAKIEYKKREGGTYINSNNPELLNDHDLNKALCRQELEGDVFFTFEHNNGISKAFYYGYQVKNNNKHDIYVTVQNMGFQLDGAGCWLGEDEWIQFYNTKFTFDTSTWNESQWKNFKDLYGFSGKYEPANNQPITYILPPGEQMYVVGGTTSDSFRNINVFNTANKKVKGGCSNVAVLFSIHGGKADGAFYVYDDPAALVDNTTHQGYITHKDGEYDDSGKLKNYGSQYIGYDTCHGVVDSETTWYFNDRTFSTLLPVTYDTYYDEKVYTPGEPYSALNPTKHTLEFASYWATHINPNSNHDGVGSDMTRYITINEDGNWVTLDKDHLDGRGQLANIGNWMVDYQDKFNFVNQGDRDRKVKLMVLDGGTCAYMIKDKDGNVLDAKYSMTRIELMEGKYSYTYTLDVPAHSVVQIVLGYNLLANSYGYMRHWVELI